MDGECPRIILETFTEYYKEIVDFLVAIGEPIVRTKNFQEYQLNRFSLYSAASMGIETNDIINILENISKNCLQKELKKYIIDKTKTYGIARIILKNNRYFIKCKDKDVLNKIKKIQEVDNSHREILNQKMEIEENFNNKNNNEKKEEENIPSFGEGFIEICPKDYGSIRDACEKEFPLLEEFDFKEDKGLELKIVPNFKSPVRSYQEKALNIMCGNGVARSGIIVLPCGAGKTLVGILAICTIKRNTIIICNNNVSVEQWYREINNWVTIKTDKDKDKDKSVICRFTSNKKDTFWNFSKEAGILITSFTMISSTKKRNPVVQEALDKLQNIDWGLMIIDEVQLLPADTFSEIVKKKFKSHCKLGLTATLVREDDRITKLSYLIGPKHYEANWLDLQKEGFLARVKCTELWSEMDPKFYQRYLDYLDSSIKAEKRKVLYLSNPTKYLATLMLLEKHKGDKIIIFSDNLFTITQYDKFFTRRKVGEKSNFRYKLITGKTSIKEREESLRSFKNEDGINVLLMTKVGDISIDIPNANVIIQVSSHFGSRMQEAQRFGRILRPKKDALSEYNAFFYTIVSKNTEEMQYSSKRHRFLVDQGYYFNIITQLEEIFDNKSSEEAKEIVKNYERDSNYLNYINDTYKIIEETSNFETDYADNLESFDILKNRDEAEISNE
jgi:DNA excision repair protein ERCC-3